MNKSKIQRGKLTLGSPLDLSSKKVCPSSSSFSQKKKNSATLSFLWSGKGKEDPELVKNKLEALTLEQKKNFVFGIPLQEVVTNTRASGAFEIPLLVRRCVDYVEQIGMKEEGIYRISGNQTDQKELRERFDAGDPFSS